MSPRGRAALAAVEDAVVPKRKRQATVTSAFGSSKRESHDASGFYSRFAAPEISNDEELGDYPVELRDQIICGDARDMSHIPDSSVALVVTSPPYFAAKQYELALGEGHIPASYIEYLKMLRDVFAECQRVLEPGGRMAINVANLGRKPYRSLSADVIRILQDDLGMLLRGEVVWMKAEGASGSCAWGSYGSSSNPSLRDITEKIIFASKGRFDRALTRKERKAEGRAHQSTITTDEFKEATLDVWKIRPASAKRIGHPAPFPVELPRRVIELLTYENDVILDPFMGSGTTGVAARQAGRYFVGYDTDANYCALAQSRVEAEAGAAAVDEISPEPAKKAKAPARRPAGATTPAKRSGTGKAQAGTSKAKATRPGRTGQKLVARKSKTQPASQ